MSRLFLNSFRGVWRTFGRFLAIVAIIAISCAFYSGIKCAAPQMKTAAWEHINASHMSDVSVRSTLGFTEDDLAYILTTKRVFSRGYASCSADVLTSGLRGDCVIHLMTYDPKRDMDIPVITEGRAPLSANEILVDARQSEDLKLSVGDTVVMTSDDGDISDMLNVTEFTVVGRASSPLYPTDKRGTSQIGTGEVTAFAYVLPDAFSYDVYTEIFLEVNGTDECEPFSKEYDELIAEAADELEKSKQALIDRRRDKIRADADVELSEAREKLNAAKKEYEDGNAEYLEFLDSYNKAKELLDSQKGELFEYTGDRDEAIHQLDLRESQMNELAATYNSVEDILARYADTYEQTVPADVLAELTRIQDLYMVNSVDANIKDLLAVYIITDPVTDGQTRETARQAIVSVNEQVRNAAWSEIGTIKTQRDAIKEQSGEMTSAGTDLITGQHKLSEAKKKLDEAQVELEEGQKKLLDAETELYKAEAELEESLSDGRIYVADRNSYDPDPMSYGEDCDRVARIADVFPVFFVLLAALVCCATMTRMVEEQRTEAGTLKALGIPSAAIIMQYVLYAAAASAIGCAIGLAVGFRTIPKVLFRCYETMYRYPGFEPVFNKDIAVGCIAAALLCTILSALYAALRELYGMPAELIRPKAPRSGKRILLERSAVWEHLPFLQKVSFRNLLRYKSRFFLMVTGIGGCTALLLTGFGLRYSISEVLDRQYGDIFQFDVLVSLDEKISLEEQTALNDAIRTTDGYIDHVYAVSEKRRVKYGEKALEANIFCVTNASVTSVADLRNKSGSIPLYDDYAVITEKMAHLLGIKSGDKIKLEGASSEIQVLAIAENHIDHYVYLTSDTYEKLYDIPKANTVLIDVSGSPDRSTRQAVTQKLIACEGVTAAVYMKDGLSNFNDLLDSLDLIVGVIILFSGLLSFVILLNLANINITERKHELATIKVLGFFDHEVGSYVYRENIITTVIGIIAGLIIGTFFERFVIVTAEVDSVMFMRDLPFSCCIYAVVMMLIFIVAVNAAVFLKLRNIDMASSMKAVE